MCLCVYVVSVGRRVPLCFMNMRSDTDTRIWKKKIKKNKSPHCSLLLAVFNRCNSRRFIGRVGPSSEQSIHQQISHRNISLSPRLIFPSSTPPHSHPHLPPITSVPLLPLAHLFFCLISPPYRSSVPYRYIPRMQCEQHRTYGGLCGDYLLTVAFVERRVPWPEKVEILLISNNNSLEIIIIF